MTLQDQIQFQVRLELESELREKIEKLVKNFLTSARNGETGRSNVMGHMVVKGLQNYYGLKF